MAWNPSGSHERLAAKDRASENARKRSEAEWAALSPEEREKRLRESMGLFERMQTQ